jgi:cell division septum initiation protein DivIVA
LRIGSSEIDVELPRALVGGLKQGPTQALLQRVALEVAHLSDENTRLEEEIETLNEEIERLQRRPADEAVEPQAGPAANVSTEPEAEMPAARVPDELARVVLAAAQRAAREIRESARRECELMLKKANTRTRKLERDLRHARVATDAELQELEALKRETCERMRSALQAILMTPDPVPDRVTRPTAEQQAALTSADRF